jgi:hypothetical protein
MNANENAIEVDAKQEQSEQIVAAGPLGAIVVTGLFVGFVIALWVAFYLFIFLPRGAIG